VSVERATIFLAHSSLDIKEARQVRNLFEEMDHDVLLLKLSQQMTESYLKGLLRREIQARDWLVMLRSVNADGSAWVGFEQHFAEVRKKQVFEIDLDKCRALNGKDLLKCLTGQVARISRNIRVFLSYSRSEHAVATRLQSDLKVRGYEVWLDGTQLRAGDDWLKQTAEAIDRTLEKGALVLLLSEAAISSPWVMREVRYALERKGLVVPCLVGRRPSRVPVDLEVIHWVDFTASYERGIGRLLATLSRSQAVEDGNSAA
jgi:hypothetical protein